MGQIILYKERYSHGFWLPLRLDFKTKTDDEDYSTIAVR